jgi:hypothetical protein
MIATLMVVGKVTLVILRRVWEFVDRVLRRGLMWRVAVVILAVVLIHLVVVLRR